ncbi:DinB family protein [Constantimarinum furrinae]|uniref:DinB-like domain-containing protein n=1 Tax=Constantimarinum furrinae TaxID=2562285 RepID=A0A7G8PXY2_9FLAO|nr:DinB family protein [Constantimarinum furrinae]QNJ99198.1 hypothetical protein ALE3EI_2671 [Constantimarinum furrinae]
MNFELQKSTAILERSPQVFDTLLRDLPDDWKFANEGPESWSPFEVMAHLIFGELTDWIPRCRIILNNIENKNFTPFDMTGHKKLAKGKSMENLLDEFSMLRKKNLEELRSWNISESDLNKTGIHSEFGEITLHQHLSTWVIHDLSHINQISRVMVKHYREDVGPWKRYFSILRSE